MKDYGSQYCQQFNTLKTTLPEVFRADDIVALFRKIGLPVSLVFWQCWKDTGNVIRVSRGYYRFKNNNPTSKELINNVYKKYMEKIMAPRKTEKPSLQVLEAIKTCQEAGLTVLIPAGSLYSKI